MNNDYFDVPDDARPYDVYADGTHKRPLISRSEAKRLWRLEREYIFFSTLMRQTTSYSAYEIDDVLAGNHKVHDPDAYWESIKREQAKRDAVLQRLAQEQKQNAELLKQIQSACSDTEQAERNEEC